MVDESGSSHDALEERWTLESLVWVAFRSRHTGKVVAYRKSIPEGFGLQLQAGLLAPATAQAGLSRTHAPAVTCA